jgi:hypothetical protein
MAWMRMMYQPRPAYPFEHPPAVATTEEAPATPGPAAEPPVER